MSKSPNFTVFSWKVFVSRGPCYKDIMGGFFPLLPLPSKSPNFQIYFWKGERFEGSELLVYNERTFSPAKTPRQGTLHDGFLVRADSAVHRRKESHIRNPGIPSHSKQGILHKESLAAAHQSHRKEGYRRFRPASAVRLSAQARFRAAKNL